MRHVDEGLIHAWLDGQVSDRAEAAWIEQHCQTCDDCRARLDEARVTLQQAGALLASIAPAAEASRPAYEALVARSGRETAGNAPVASPAAPARFRTWQLAAGWAASVALAAALGWMVRDDWRGDEQVPQLASREVTPQEAPTAAPPDPAVAAPLEATAQASGGPSTPPAEGLAQPGAAAPASAAASSAADRATSGQAQRRLAAPLETASAGPATDARARLAQPAVEPFTATAESAVRDALPTPAAQGSADGDTVQFRAVPPILHVPPEAAGVAPRPVATPPPPPAAVAAPSPAAGGGRGGGGGTAAGVGAGVPAILDATSARSVAAEPSGSTVSTFAAPERATAQGGRIMVDGMTLTPRADSAASQSAAWRQMPRTEAAARTGMALYGITGLTASMTMLSADGTIVRTIYETGLGEAVEIWQQRTPSPDAAGRASLGGQTLNRPPDTLTGSWTATYADVQVTLRGGADVASWGERLRVE